MPCEYAKAKCQGQHMYIYYLGACVNDSSNPAQTTPFTSTEGTTKHFHLSQRIEELFCSQRNSIPCDTTLNPVCATDGKFYQNSCEYTKARCENPTLLLQELEVCKG
ncbi:hypothetical protein CHS0354_001470 [Potamilus streckersoni]|uniref:Kazal-like domain-containing protein n=1 Tax=Potamilus streckersoni TaxID=2493646 RepID=A0AAE0T947_9BIVA|nr:hypothetical protein CHS0354_001470 [Potamilus streckersoni]